MPFNSVVGNLAGTLSSKFIGSVFAFLTGNIVRPIGGFLSVVSDIGGDSGPFDVGDNNPFEVGEKGPFDLGDMLPLVWFDVPLCAGIFIESGVEPAPGALAQTSPLTCGMMIKLRFYRTFTLPKVAEAVKVQCHFRNARCNISVTRCSGYTCYEDGCK